jgi:hypothetical protein
MIEGMAFCRLIRDREGRPCDWLYLDVNPPSSGPPAFAT